MCGKTLACGHVCQVWCKNPCTCVCATFQAMKTQNETRKMQDHHQMHMDLEELLQAEAAGDRLPELNPPKQEDMQMVLAKQTPALSYATVAKPRGFVRLDIQEPRKLGPARGRPQTKVANRAIRQPTKKLVQPPSKPPGPIVRLPPPRRQQRVAQSGVTAYQKFVENIDNHDMANVKARQASLAETAGQVPQIMDTYRPVTLVDGRRVETPSNSSPEKEGEKILIQENPTPSSTVINSEVDSSSALLPELLLNGDSDVFKESTPAKEGVRTAFGLASALGALPEDGGALPRARSANTPTRQRSAGQRNGRSRSTNSVAVASGDSQDFSGEGFSSHATTVDPTDGYANKGHGKASLDLATLVYQPTASRLSAVQEEALCAQPQAYADLDNWLDTLPPVNGDVEQFQEQPDVSDTDASAVPDMARGDKEEEREEGDCLISL